MEVSISNNHVSNETAEQDINEDFDINSEDQTLITTGLRLLQKGNSNDAVFCFQNYLRMHPDNFEGWQCLANAYMQRGSYNTAIRAFLKSIKLKNEQQTTHDQNDKLYAENQLYAELKIAEIHRLLHSYEEAVQDYKSILETHEDYIPALIGLSETLFVMAQQAFSDGYIYSGYRFCVEAIKYLKQTVDLRSDLCITYDLLCQCNLVMLMHTNKDQKTLRIHSMEDGIRYANCALSINCGMPAYWHHLALFYWYMYQENEDTCSLSKSIQCLLNALKLNPTNRNIWNTLGVVASDCLPLAQHCFLKALRCNGANSEVLWSNLAICYLLDASKYIHFADEAVMRAHQAFCQSQAQNPYFVNCWIGQALVAESLNHYDTLDLFRHCNALAYHPLAAIKFAYHLLHEPQQHCLRRELYSLCIDRLCRFIEKDCDYVAYNLLGNLYERLGFKRQALVQFELAVTCSTNANEFEKQSIFTNFLRNAVHVYAPQQLVKYEDLCDKSWQISVYFAISYCKQHQYESAAEKIKIALQLIESNSELYEQIRSLQYLIARKIESASDPWQNPIISNPNQDQFEEQSECTDNSERKIPMDSLKNNSQLRVAIVMDALKQRRFDDQLQRIFAVMFEHPSLLDGLLLTLFSPNASKQLVHCHPHQAHCWILHALSSLIHADRMVKSQSTDLNKLHLYVQIFQQIVIQSNLSINQLVAGHLVSAIGLLQTATDPNQRKTALKSAQAAYHIKPYSNKIKALFKCIKQQSLSKDHSKLIELPLNKIQLVHYILTLLY